MQKKKRLIWIFGLLCLAWTAVIFSFSLQDGETSSVESEAALGFFNRILAWFGADGLLSELFIRKAAHFMEYCVLGMLVFTAFFGLNRRWAPLWGEAYAFAVANFDEFVCQNISRGRGPSFFDVLLDSAGAGIGILIAFLVCLLVSNKKRKSCDKISKSA